MFFKEWVDWGLHEIEASLSRHAAFDHYCATHPPSEDPCPNSTTPNSPNESSEPG